MTREEIYIKLNRIEMLADDLKLCYENDSQPDFMPDDVKLGEYAEEILAYIRANNDEKVMIDCCKINRAILYRFMGTRRDPMGMALLLIRRCLWKIHNYALSAIWGVSDEDIENCTYYVNSVEGVCRNSNTGELLPRPTDNAPEDGETLTNAPTMGLPSEFDTPEAKKIFDELVKLNYCKRDGAVYQWTATNALFGYMVWKVSDKLEIRHDNDRLPWDIFQRAFTLTDRQIRTAKNATSKVKNKQQNEPTGYDEIDRLCK